MTAEVIEIDRVVDSDIPASLRFLADWLEENPDEATKIIVITANSDTEHYPSVYAYGRIENKADIVYNMEMAKVSVLTHDGVVNG